MDSTQIATRYLGINVVEAARGVIRQIPLCLAAGAFQRSGVDDEDDGNEVELPG